MKKLFLTLGAAMLGISSFAGTRILYQQNFESVSTPEEAGWSIGGGTMSIGSDFEGKFLDLQLGQNNGRSAIVSWNENIFLKDGQSVLTDGEYTVKYAFSIITPPNNQYGTEMTIFTNHAPVTNQGYRLPWNPSGVWSNYVLDIFQTDTSAVSDMTVAVNAPFAKTENEDGSTTYSIDATGPTLLLNSGSWFTAVANVNVNTRKVEYEILDISEEPVISGEMTVPETDLNGDPISMYAQGLFIMMTRYQTRIQLDNIEVYFESSEDVANKPTVALTRLGKTADEELNLNLRAYTMTFLEDETLNVKGTDGKTFTVDWADCDGSYVYETTTSGTLEAWTTCGSAKSEVVTMDVDCTPCPLPSVVATISAVNAGYGKSYKLSIDNSDVPLRPTIFIDYEFTGKDGSSDAKLGLNSGEVVTVPGEGTIKLTAKAFGYEENTSSIDNNIEFEVKKVYDFARQTDEQLAEIGFKDWVLNNSSVTSGFGNWTARRYLYYFTSENGVYDRDLTKCVDCVFPFGYISDDDTEHVLYECTLPSNEDGTVYFEDLDIWTGQNIGWLKHIGVYNNATGGGNFKNITIMNLDKTDFVVANNIGGYGGNSNHPVCSTTEEYYQKLEGENTVYSVAADGAEDAKNEGKYQIVHPVYRIDTACSKITVYAQKGAEGGVEGITADEVENADPYYYTIDGLRVVAPTRPGLYIHNGKKIVVK